MQLSQTRLTCRAHNRFNPSTALWQHFVQASPSNPRDRRQLSTATKAAQDDANASTKDAQSESSSPSEARHAHDIEVTTGKTAEKPSAEPSPWQLRKMTTVKGRWLPTKAESSIAKNIHLQNINTKAESESQLKIARDAFAKSKDYKGVVVRPVVSGEPIKESELPWCTKKEDRETMSGFNRLHLEIAKFYGYTKPDRYETTARKHIIKQVRRHVRESLPKYNIEVFGSERTGIAMPLSDIDFRLLIKPDKLNPTQARLPPGEPERKKGTLLLQQLYHRTFKRNGAYILPALRYARYPLVAAQDRKSGLDIQVVLSNDTSISRVIMEEYMEEIPYLRELYWVVKTLFDIRGLSDVFRGGFGSYSLFMMVVASIKHAPEPPKDSARALIHFLDFWGTLDTTKHGVSIEPAYLFDKATHPVLTKAQRTKLENGEAKPSPAYMLSLRDPADETNDLGRKGIAIKHVQVTLRYLRDQLIRDTKANTRPSILSPLVGTSYMLQLERRKKLQDYGRFWWENEHKDLARLAKEMREAGSAQEASSPVLSLDGGVVQRPNEVEAAVPKALKKQAKEEAKGEEALKKQIEEEETRLRLAREVRDEEWKKLTEERNARLRNEAEKTSLLEHSDAMTSILGMPAVEEETKTSRDRVEEESEEVKGASSAF